MSKLFGILLLALAAIICGQYAHADVPAEDRVKPLEVGRHADGFAQSNNPKVGKNGVVANDNGPRAVLYADLPSDLRLYVARLTNKFFESGRMSVYKWMSHSGKLHLIAPPYSPLSLVARELNNVTGLIRQKLPYDDLNAFATVLREKISPLLTISSHDQLEASVYFRELAILARDYLYGDFLKQRVFVLRHDVKDNTSYQIIVKAFNASAFSCSSIPPDVSANFSMAHCVRLAERASTLSLIKPLTSPLAKIGIDPVMCLGQLVHQFAYGVLETTVFSMVESKPGSILNPNVAVDYSGARPSQIVADFLLSHVFSSRLWLLSGTYDEYGVAKRFVRAAHNFLQSRESAYDAKFSDGNASPSVSFMLPTLCILDNRVLALFARMITQNPILSVQFKSKILPHLSKEKVMVCFTSIRKYSILVNPNDLMYTKHLNFLKRMIGRDYIVYDQFLDHFVEEHELDTVGLKFRSVQEVYTELVSLFRSTVNYFFSKRTEPGAPIKANRVIDLASELLSHEQIVTFENKRVLFAHLEETVHLLASAFNIS